MNRKIKSTADVLAYYRRLQEPLPAEVRCYVSSLYYHNKIAGHFGISVKYASRMLNAAFRERERQHRDR